MARVSLPAAPAARLDDCRACGLRQEWPPVPAGPPAGRLLVLLGPPNPDEHLLGRPGEGAAGDYLRRVLAEAGLAPDHYWLAHAARCPGDSAKAAAAAKGPCRGWLLADLAGRQPAAVLAMGAAAVAGLGLKGPLRGLLGGPHASPVWPAAAAFAWHAPASVLSGGRGLVADTVALFRRAREAAACPNPTGPESSAPAAPRPPSPT
jgi:uracil-DNA glycosylase